MFCDSKNVMERVMIHVHNFVKFTKNYENHEKKYSNKGVVPLFFFNSYRNFSFCFILCNHSFSSNDKCIIFKSYINYTYLS